MNNVYLVGKDKKKKLSLKTTCKLLRQLLESGRVD